MVCTLLFETTDDIVLFYCYLTPAMKKGGRGLLTLQSASACWQKVLCYSVLAVHVYTCLLRVLLVCWLGAAAA